MKQRPNAHVAASTPQMLTRGIRLSKRYCSDLRLDLQVSYSGMDDLSPAAVATPLHLRKALSKSPTQPKETIRLISELFMEILGGPV